MAAPDAILTRDPGTYALCLHLPEPRPIKVGALGTWDFPAGYYIYVGSAWGPGGIAARLGRHLKGSHALRWHIDYLRAESTPVAIWIAPGQHAECDWAAHLLANQAARIIVPRFGASDCTCPAHLAYVGEAAPAAFSFPGGQNFDIS